MKRLLATPLLGRVAGGTLAALLELAGLLIGPAPILDLCFGEAESTITRWLARGDSSRDVKERLAREYGPDQVGAQIATIDALCEAVRRSHHFRALFC
jgi:hypothetical protein